jgi:hypothetical protein
LRKRRGRVELVTAISAPADDDEALERLRDALAQAVVEPRLAAVVANQARSGDWRAAAWLLEHVHGWKAGEVRATPQNDELAAIRARIEAHRR